MSRFAGYIGLINHGGAGFMASEPALGAVMQDVADRGLVFIDDGSAAQSLASTLATVTGAPTAKADIIIGMEPRPGDLESSLQRLEALARERGHAIGLVYAQVLDIDRVAQFAQGLEARGIALVPLSALVNAPARTSAR
jgi:polysaccharide deacetylase 2 family uncharacterized protein YibQ